MCRIKAIEICKNLRQTITKIEEKDQPRMIIYQKEEFRPPQIRKSTLLKKIKYLQQTHNIKDSEIKV